MSQAKGRTAELSVRHDLLLCAIQHQGGEWTTGRAHYVLRESGLAPNRTTARDDLTHLARLGRLVEHDEAGRSFYTLPGGPDE